MLAQQVYQLPLWILALVILIPPLVAMELGAWNGRRLRRKSGEAGQANGAKRGDIEIGALFALMGLVLAFTYAFTLSRYDLRKEALVQETNAIGTAFLRADLLPEPGASELRESLLTYARTRVIHDEAVRSYANLRRYIAKSVAAQENIWPAMERALEGDFPDPHRILVVQAINEVIDAHTRRIAVGFDRLPPSVFFFMIVLAMLSVALASQNDARDGTYSRANMSIFALVLSCLIFIILDFDNSWRGLIQMSQENLLALIRDMETRIQ